VRIPTGTPQHKKGTFLLSLDKSRTPVLTAHQPMR
jgi:hypothetical protein